MVLRMAVETENRQYFNDVMRVFLKFFTLLALIFELVATWRNPAPSEYIWCYRFLCIICIMSILAPPQWLHRHTRLSQCAIFCTMIPLGIALWRGIAYWIMYGDNSLEMFIALFLRWGMLLLPSICLVTDYRIYPHCQYK